MGKAKRLGTKPAVAITPANPTKKPPVAIAAVSVPRSDAVEIPSAPPGGAANDTDEPVELYDVVCSIECVVASGLTFGPAQIAAREHNAAHAAHDPSKPTHDAQPIRRRTP